MPKPVEAPNSYVSPPAANIEDMTQPMGPLEEGDQALVDAANKVPEGRQEIRHSDGAVTWLGKQTNFGHNIVTVHRATPEGSTHDAAVLISKVPGVEGISGDISDKTAWDHAGGSRAHVSGNTVGEDVLHMQAEPNRKEAQAVKDLIADRIDKARERADSDRAAA